MARRKKGDIPQDDSPETIPLGEYGDPDDAAFVVASLLKRLAAHITGDNIRSTGAEQAVLVTPDNALAGGRVKATTSRSYARHDQQLGVRVPGA